jgi:hypothetical protein
MTEIPLRDYLSKKQIFWINTETLDYRIQKYDWVEDVEYTNCKGFATLFRRTFFKKEIAAIYMDGNILYFQAGLKRWNIGELNVRIKWKKCLSIIRYCFKIYENERIIFKHKYLSSFFFNPLCWIDFTYDPLDAELNDFFMWIGKSVMDKFWINNIKANWVQGIVGETEEKLISELSRKEKFHSQFVQGLSKQLRDLSERGHQKRKTEIARKLEEIKRWKKYKEEMKNK